MYYVDSQLTITRRDSSLIVPKRTHREFDAPSTARIESTPRLSDSGSTTSAFSKPKGSTRNELITQMFESMLYNIVESWEVIVPIKVPDESVPLLDFGDLNSKPQSKKQRPVQPPKKSKKSRSSIQLDTTQPAPQCWWSAPDERAIIRFRNGNVYQGNISMKSMNGDGRFQWANGTIYLGDFKNNEISGRGKIQWKDDTWYEGEFLSNIRHGSGLYVDSRRQRSYMGGWNCGTKHGQGVIYYSGTFKNSYDGDWVQNVRHGKGIREYCAQSGYIGEWDNNVREGTGLMIWPNRDFYNGGWKNGLMSGKGVYTWDTNLNDTMSYPSINVYHGQWFRGMRNGYGTLNLGYGMGSYYKGEFVDNKKHGKGKLVTNNGFILRDYNQLFRDDNMTSLGSQQSISEGKSDPFLFNICDSSVGLLNHIEKAVSNLDRDKEIRASLINDYLRYNKIMDCACVQAPNSPEEHTYNLIDFVDFEESSLRKAIRCYSTELNEIYYTYATICNSKRIYFDCVMLRLYLWQLYFDCNIHEKGLTLVGIDRMFYQNRDWLANKPHDPFEKIYFWQFIHSLILVACKLYCQKTLPSIKPDTILASAFRHFMETDVLPAVGRRRGKLVNGFGEYIPLKHVYSLYLSIGEPHTIRKFLMCVRTSPHQLDHPQPDLLEASDDMLPIGRNVYLYGDQMSFVTETGERFDEDQYNIYKAKRAQLKLFNFGNLSSKLIITLFGHIFPQVFQNDKVLDLNVDITFFEFFEVLISCIEESIRVKDEELRWREKFSTDGQLSTA